MCIRDSTDGTHKTLCYYSLGNIISTMYEYYTMVGGLASFDIVKTGDTISIEEPLVIPTMCCLLYTSRCV